MSISFDPSIKAAFGRDGVVAIRGFFEPHEIGELTERVARYKRDVVPNLAPGLALWEVDGRPDTLKMLHGMADHDPYFALLRDHPKVSALARLLLDGDTVWQGCGWFDKPVGFGVATPPHQDAFYQRLEPAQALSYWIPLEPVDESNGCMRYLPGSHLGRMRRHGWTQDPGFILGITDYGAEDASAEVALSAKPGDVLVHHSMTVHRTAANQSTTRSRPALGTVFHSVRAKQDPTTMEAYRQKDPAVGRALLAGELARMQGELASIDAAPSGDPEASMRRASLLVGIERLESAVRLADEFAALQAAHTK